jgi:hypothetical protein
VAGINLAGALLDFLDADFKKGDGAQIRRYRRAVLLAQEEWKRPATHDEGAS